MRKGIIVLPAVLAVLTLVILAVPAWANPVTVEYEDGPQDPLSIPPECEELGDGFPADELIESSHIETELTSCNEFPFDDPGIPNILVTMTNLTNTTWCNVHYVADPETSISNFDGYIKNAGSPEGGVYAFKIDNAGVNQPLVSESMTQDNCFEPGETWEFILQDFNVGLMGGNPTPFDSLGIANASGGPSTGSIIAPVPEILTIALLVMGLMALGGFVWYRRHRKPSMQAA